MPSREQQYHALLSALADVAALGREHEGEGTADPLRNAALDVWHDVLTMSWKQDAPDGLNGDELVDHIGRTSFAMGVLAGSRLRRAESEA